MIHHIDAQFFLESVLPELPEPQITGFFEQYSAISFTEAANMQPLSEAPVLMLVALTGTGKSTTLEKLEVVRVSGAIHYWESIPSRRDIADFVIIPTAQKLLGEAIQPVRDRVQRFFYTRTFAKHIAGGMGEAYSWLYHTTNERIPIISEGIRGANEIAFSLEHCPGWQIVELTVSPLTRLKRLSTRNENFDQAVGTNEIDFLPDGLQPDIIQAIQSGEISARALAIIRAEAENYGLEPYSQPHPRYHCINTESRSPEQVAYEVRQVVEVMMNHAAG